MKIIASIVLVAASLVAVPVAAVGAEPSDSELVMMGIGTRSCGEFSEAYQSSPQAAEIAYFSWAQGYMSAANNVAANAVGPGGTYRNRDLNSMPSVVQQYAIRSYCDQNPLALYFDAVLDLYGRFSLVEITR